MARKRSDGIWIRVTPEELERMDDICDYLGISRAEFVRIFIDYVYNRACMGNEDQDIEEFAAAHNVSWGIIADMIGGYDV